MLAIFREVGMMNKPQTNLTRSIDVMPYRAACKVIDRMQTNETFTYCRNYSYFPIFDSYRPI